MCTGDRSRRSGEGCWRLPVLLLLCLSPSSLLAAGPRPQGQAAPLPRWREPADPPPLSTVDYLDLTVIRERGALRVASVDSGRFPRPRTILPRFRGRFEVRLLDPGSRLRDVVRFDLPLTGGAGESKSSDASDALGRKLSLGVSARIRVRVPLDGSITTAVVHDRLTRASTRVDLKRFHPPLPALKLPPPGLPQPLEKKPDPAAPSRKRRGQPGR